eukprot:scaffold1593_cov156-Amphora_coffeaeformis.AAC.5
MRASSTLNAHPQRTPISPTLAGLFSPWLTVDISWRYIVPGSSYETVIVVTAFFVYRGHVPSPFFITRQWSLPFINAVECYRPP